MSFSAACNARFIFYGLVAGDESPVYRPGEFIRKL